MSYMTETRETPLGVMRLVNWISTAGTQDRSVVAAEKPTYLEKQSPEYHLALLLMQLGAYFFTASEGTLWRAIWENVQTCEQTNIHDWMQSILTRSRAELTAICRQNDCVEWIRRVQHEWEGLSYSQRTTLNGTGFGVAPREQYVRFADFFQFMMGHLTYFRNLQQHYSAPAPTVRTPSRQPDVLESILGGSYVPPGRQAHQEPAPEPAKRKKSRKKPRKPQKAQSTRLLSSGSKAKRADIPWDTQEQTVGAYEFVGFSEKQAQIIEQILSTILPAAEKYVTRIELRLDQKTVGVRTGGRKLEQWDIDTDILPQEGTLVLYPSFFSLSAMEQRKMIVYEIQKCENFDRVYTQGREPEIQAVMPDLEASFPFWSPYTDPLTNYIEAMAEQRTSAKVPTNEVNFYQVAMLLATMRVEPDEIRNRYTGADVDVYGALGKLIRALDGVQARPFAKRARAAEKIPKIRAR